ncbi:hypothetical protein KAR91_69185 [Candidatus Pacearchaeota archaeon]|nr:hypothetical protein [Candidatus Pacearchaeota archaeon]
MIEKLEPNFINADTNKIITKVNELVDAANKPAVKKPAVRKASKSK